MGSASRISGSVDEGARALQHCNRPVSARELLAKPTRSRTSARERRSNTPEGVRKELNVHYRAAWCGIGLAQD